MCIARLMPHWVPPRIDAASVLTGTHPVPVSDPRGTAECPMTVTAVGSPVTAEAFVIASEPAPGPAAGAARPCAAVLRTAPNRLICTRCGDGARPRRDANIRQGHISGSEAGDCAHTACRLGYARPGLLRGSP